ncbi:MAG TPA: pitrilysin family protein [Terriglobales bacterium]|nr:pitrilysin family protein [Terriglobales bacterium]
MKPQTLAPVLLAAIAMTGFAPIACGQATDWQQIPIPPLPAFHPQEPKRIALPNGMVIFLEEDHELPLIDGIANIRGGSRDEPANKVGLLDMYGEVWRTGGTKSETGDQFDDYLEVRAAKVETSASSESTSISWSCLKEDFDDVFKVFIDLLRNPEFREDKLDLAKREMDDAISRRNDDISDIASRESTKLAYGKDNPLARQPEYATVARVTRQDLIDWHNSHVAPNNIIVGVVGDFDAQAIEAKLREAFAQWPQGQAVKSPALEFAPAKPGYYLIPKTDVNQSSIQMVALGMRRDNPDYFAAQVFNEAFGGGFSSRLFRNIRTAKGLAYGVGGGIGSGFDHPGTLRLSLETKSASTLEAIQAVYEQIADLKTNPISDEEIARAKDSILNSFVFNFDSPEKVLHERMLYEFYAYPANFLERFRNGVEQTQKADVARVAAKYVHQDQLKVLVVGNTAEFDKPLSSLGPVTNLDISIPPPPGEKNETPEKPSASNEEGKALAQEVVERMGGLAKLQSVKSLREDLRQKASEDGPATPVQRTIVFPDRMHMDIQTPRGVLSIVVTPEEGFMSATGIGARELPASQKNENIAQIHRDIIYIGQHLEDPGSVFFADGREQIGDVETRIVDVSVGDMAIRWFVDSGTGHILRETYEGMGRSGPFHAETDLSDWKTTDGITLPATHKNKENGRQTSIVEFTRIDFNPTVDPKLFEPPAVASQTPPQ